MPPSTSFRSGHAASGFAFALAVGEELPALLALLVPLAGAVAYSRVHVGVHHPSDVAAGIAIGLASGSVAQRVPLATHWSRPIDRVDARPRERIAAGQ
jgi:undecaprenyl-diphosphatase